MVFTLQKMDLLKIDSFGRELLKVETEILLKSTQRKQLEEKERNNHNLRKRIFLSSLEKEAIKMLDKIKAVDVYFTQNIPIKGSDKVA